VFLGDVIGESMGYTMNELRVMRGKARQRRFGGEISVPPIETLNQFLELATKPTPDRIGAKAVEITAKTTGIPYAQFKRAYKGWDEFAATRDPRHLVWSKSALAPTDVESAMVRRATKSGRSKEDTRVLAEWMLDSKRTGKERISFIRKVHAELKKEADKPSEWTLEKTKKRMKAIRAKAAEQGSE